MVHCTANQQQQQLTSSASSVTPAAISKSTATINRNNKALDNMPHSANSHVVSNVPEEVATAVRKFVQERGGDCPIHRVLLANNGIAAVKEIRSVRKWAYETFGNDRAIEFVAMATPDDFNANAEYIKMADRVVNVPGGSNNNNFANVALVVRIAQEEGVQVGRIWLGNSFSDILNHSFYCVALLKQNVLFCFLCVPLFLRPCGLVGVTLQRIQSYQNS